MNVLLLINSFSLGGAEKLAYDLTEHLSRYDDLHVFLCCMGTFDDNLEAEIKKRLREKGLKCINLHKPARKGRIKVVADIKKIVNKYNIDIIHTNGQSPDFYARILKFFNRKIKILTVIHNTAGYSRKIERFQSYLTNAYVAVSDETGEYGRYQLGIKKEIHVIDNGIDVNLYSEIENKAKNFSIVSVGRVEPQKGYLETVKKLKPFLINHSDVKWKIYGSYKENSEYYGELMDLIRKLNLENNIDFMGVETDPHKIYGDAKCFVLGSQYEGFGIAFLEAMAVGLPVFCRKIGVINNLNASGCIYFDLDDENIVEKLEDLYNTGGIEKSIAEKNREIIKQSYDVKIVAEKYHNLYCDLMRK